MNSGTRSRRRSSTIRPLVVCSLLLLSSPAFAGRAFERLEEDRYTITVSGVGSAAIQSARRYAASVCVAAGFSHLEVLESGDPDSSPHRPDPDRYATGSAMVPRSVGTTDLDVRFFREKGERELVQCKPLSDPKLVEKARKKLAKLEAQENT